MSILKRLRLLLFILGIDGTEISLDDPKILKKVEIKCNCNCATPKCEHKLAVVTFLKIKREFKRCNNNTSAAGEDLERTIPGGEIFCHYDLGQQSLVYTNN
jgi:hypothetical protein